MRIWAWRLLLLPALTAIACSDSHSPEIAPPEAEIEQPYLYDVYLVNSAWGYLLRGTYVDNQGNVVSYDHSFERWTPKKRHSFTLRELKDKYIAPTDTLAHVDQETLLDMFSLIEEASLGELSEGTTTGFDMGTYAHVCYRYDQSTNRYIEVLLSEAGDYTRTNLSDAAVELVDWLNTVLADAYGEGK